MKDCKIISDFDKKLLAIQEFSNEIVVDSTLMAAIRDNFDVIELSLKQLKRKGSRRIYEDFIRKFFADDNINPDTFKVAFLRVQKANDSRDKKTSRSVPNYVNAPATQVPASPVVPAGAVVVGGKVVAKDVVDAVVLQADSSALPLKPDSSMAWKNAPLEHVLSVLQIDFSKMSYLDDVNDDKHHFTEEDVKIWESLEFAKKSAGGRFDVKTKSIKGGEGLPKCLGDINTVYPYIKRLTEKMKIRAIDLAQQERENQS